MSPNRRRWAGLLVAVSVALVATLEGAGTDWRQITGQRFVLRARVSVKDLPAVACELEQVTGAVQQVYAGRDRTPRTAGTVDMLVAPTVSVVAVNNERDLRELLPQFWEHRGARPLGAYWSGIYGHHIVIRVDVPARQRLRRILHEYAHFATHVAYPDAPLWLDEGLSELWTNAAVDREQVEIGRPIATHLRLLKATGDWIPVKDLVAAKSLPSTSDRRKLARFYAESWALIHYLVFERGGGRLAIDFHPDFETLPPDAELQRYIKEWHQRSTKIHVPAADRAGETCTAPDAHEMEPLDALLGQAQALADGERPAAALPVLRQASSLAPSNPQVTETTGVVRFLANESTEAVTVFDQLISAGTASHLSYYYRAVLAEVAPLRRDGAGPVPVAQYLREALRLSPGFGPARERLAGIGERP